MYTKPKIQTNSFTKRHQSRQSIQVQQRQSLSDSQSKSKFVVFLPVIQLQGIGKRKLKATFHEKFSQENFLFIYQYRYMYSTCNRFQCTKRKQNLMTNIKLPIYAGLFLTLDMELQQTVRNNRTEKA